MAAKWTELGQDPARQQTFESYVQRLGQGFLSRIQGRTDPELAAADNVFLLKLELKVVTAAPGTTVAPKVVTDVAGRAGAASQSASSSPTEEQMSPSEQAAPGQLLEKLKSTLDDAKKNLGDNLGSEDMRKKLLSLAEETAVKLPASLIPFGIGKEPAEKLTRVLVDGAIKRVMSRGGSQDGQTTQSPAPDGKNPTISPQTSQVEPKASKPDDTGLKIEGASPLPIDSKIPIEEAQKVLRKLYNSHQRYVEQNPSSSKEDQKKSLDEELEDDLKLNKVIRPVLTPADRAWFHDQITAIVYGKSRIEPIRDEISKKLDEFDLDLLKSSVTDEAGAQTVCSRRLRNGSRFKSRSIGCCHKNWKS